MFCDCGGLIISEDGKLVCSDCDKIQVKGFSLSSKQKEKKKMHREDTQKNPVTKMTCTKCGHEECEYWLLQTRASDEPPTRFYKCTKCGYTWREYA